LVDYIFSPCIRAGETKYTVHLFAGIGYPSRLRLLVLQAQGKKLRSGNNQYVKMVENNEDFHQLKLKHQTVTF
jgi:hypothetical protein